MAKRKRNHLFHKHCKKVVQECYDCMECYPIGDGDHFCSKYAVLVIEDYVPNENYLYCKKGIEEDE